jgi:hypothetical protein
MRRALKRAFPAVVAAWLFAAPAGAQDDPAKDARLAAFDGKFIEADGIIERAGPEVQNDADLRLAIGELALKFARAKEGEARRGPLESARRHFAKVVEVRPSDAKGAAGVLTAAGELADLDREARKFDDEKAQMKFAIDFGEKALAGGVASPAFKAALGRAYGRHASFFKNMKDRDLLVAESTKAATLLAEASAGDEQPGKLLSEASAIRLRAAHLVHEGVPVDSEKADDEALAAAIELATKACGMKGATDSDYAVQLRALTLAHSWGVAPTAKPFMQPLVPPLEGIKIEISRSGCWKRMKNAPDWELELERDLKDDQNFGVIQISFARLQPSVPILGKPWSQLAEVAKRLYEADMTTLETVSHKVEPIPLGGKGGIDVYHFEVGGQMKGGRAKRIGQWIGFIDKKREEAFQLRMYDWRRLPDFREPDIDAFVASVVGPGVWPPGAAAPATDPKKPPKKK